MTTFIEFVGGVTFLVHLLFFNSPQNAFSTLLHSMINKFFIMPYAFLMNTSHNKDRILEHGWKNVLRNMIKCGLSRSSVDLIENNAKRGKKNQIDPEVGATNSETNNIFTISSSEIQTSSVINDSSITDEPSHSKGRFDDSNSRPTCHRDIELLLLDIEKLNETEPFETLSVRQLDGMLKCLNNESEYIRSFETLLRIVDCNRNEKTFLKIDIEHDLSSGCVAHKESIEGKSKNDRKRQTITNNKYSIDKRKRPINIFIDERKRIIRMEKRRGIIRKILQFAKDQDRFDYYLNLLIDLEEILLMKNFSI